MQRFLDSIGRSDGAVYIGLFQSWREVAGDRIADHTQPVDVRGHTLIVESDHPAWTQMVMMHRSRILKQLTNRFPKLELTSLAVRLAGSAGPGNPPGSGPGSSPGPRGQSPPPGGAGAPAPGLSPPPLADAPASREPAPPPPSPDAKSAIERIDDPDFRDTLRRLRDEISSSDRDRARGKAHDQDGAEDDDD